MTNIILIGFMGSGKSKVGERLANFYGMKFIDTDSMIEKETGLTIPEIFKKYGEKYFREIEKKIIKRLINIDNCVISTGGGVILSEENINILKKIGTIFYLYVPLDEAKKRIKNTKNRPLFHRSEELFKSRLPIYKKTADYIINTSKCSEEDVVDKIKAYLKTTHIPINFCESRSDIYVVKKGLKEIGKYLSQYDIAQTGMIVTNPTVSELYLDTVKSSLINYNFKPIVGIIPDGEEYKTLEYAGKLYDICVENKLDRKSYILALGGGVIGDIAGFVASTYRRGIPFFQVPTTLLAQVDASIGGKTAINHPKAKNMIGTFYQPKFVFSCVEVLKTLPIREIKNGLAEVVKYGIIRDKKLFEYLEKNVEKILNYDIDALFEIIKRSIEIKKEVVEIDEKEEGLRAILNYGHTLGHAIEAIGDYKKLTHGEAISIGMVYASLISQKMGKIGDKEVERVINLLRKIGLPTSIKTTDIQKIWKTIELDKKVMAGKLRMILSSKIGECEIVEKLDKNLLKSVLKNLSSNGN